MFAAVFFSQDGKCECMNVKKIKKISGVTGRQTSYSLNEHVFVTFKTMMLDDAGREKEKNVDYDGVVLYQNKEKAAVLRYIETHNPPERDEDLDQKTLEDLSNSFNDQLNDGSQTAKRKPKKSSRLLSFEEEEEAVSCPSTPHKKKKSKNDDFEDSPAKSTRSKKSPKKSTIKTGALTAETQKLQAAAYFKKKLQKDVPTLPPQDQDHIDSRNPSVLQSLDFSEDLCMGKNNPLPIADNQRNGLSQDFCIKTMPFNLRPTIEIQSTRHQEEPQHQEQPRLQEQPKYQRQSRHQDQQSRQQDQPRHQDQQPRHQDQQPRHQDQQPRHQDQQPGRQDQQPRHQDKQPRHQDQQSRHQDQQS
ncbi:RNA polymerase II degradation factor 1-like [Pecten maximus]|uniref:RNA polymerase II degradation factor 1-like n=1 Tax=Pecten maximus TaxID=6579 RepID=UPI001458A239|nr:RNA polymerase II degradation factor 1-like [Pecten maximus]